MTSGVMLRQQHEGRISLLVAAEHGYAAVMHWQSAAGSNIRKHNPYTQCTRNAALISDLAVYCCFQ